MHPVYLTLAGTDIEDDIQRLGRAQAMEGASGSGNTALHMLSEAATIQGAWQRMVQYLVERGDDVNCQNRQGQTPLCRAAARGNAELTQALLEAGACWLTPDMDGISALERALAKPGSETSAVMLAWVRRQALGDMTATRHGGGVDEEDQRQL